MDYVAHIVVIAGIYVILSASLDLLVGHTGLLSVAQAAFYAVGAYASALMSIHFEVSFGIATLSAVVAASAMSSLMALASLRLRGDYFVIATFALQMLVFGALNNLTAITRGPLGIVGIPPPSVAGWIVDTNVEYVFIVSLLAAVSWLLVRRITQSPYGRVLHAIREDEGLAATLGKNVPRFKIEIVAISASLAAVAGSLYAGYITYIDPTSFTIDESILILAMVIIGGAGSLWGPVTGAVVLVMLPEVLRFVGLPHVVAAGCRQIIYGSLLVAAMLLRPKGLMGTHVIGGGKGDA